MHRFVIQRQGQTHVYDQYHDIPADLDHVIEFLPDIPAGPHTPEQHREIHSWNHRLQALMRIEHARSSQTG